MRSSNTNAFKSNTCIRFVSIFQSLKSDRLYTKDHEWVVVEDGVAKIGITEHAQESLGRLVYCKVPAVGDKLGKTEACGAVESAKAAGDIISPVSGEVLEVNYAVEDLPQLVNRQPYGEGWMFKVRVEVEEELGELFDETAYQEYCQLCPHLANSFLLKC